MRVPVRNVGQYGIIKDKPDYELPENAWSDGNNVAFRDNVAQKIGGHTEVFATPTITPRWMLAFPTTTNHYWFYASLDKVYLTDGATHNQDRTRYTVTPGDNDYSADADTGWNGGVLGGLPILNNGVDVPQKSTIGAGLLQDLANWPASTVAKVIRPFKQFLIAIDTTESAVNYPFRVRWSDAADSGSEPSTWVAGATNLAGDVDLLETPDYVVDCAPLRNVNIIYKQDSTWTMRFIGGNDVFAFEKLFLEHGILTRNCVAQFGDAMHFVVTTGDIIIHNGNTAESIIDEKNRAEIFDNIDQTYFKRSFVVPNYRKDEIWFCYPTAGSTYANKAAIWHRKSGQWSFRDLPVTPFIAYGVVEDTATGGTIDSYTGTIDSYTDPFDSQQYNPTVYKMLMADTTPKFFIADDSNQFDSSNFTAQLKRTGLAMVAGKQGNYRDPYLMKYVNALWPKMKGGPVDIYVGVSDTDDGNYTWDGPHSFNPATDYKVDVRVSGRFLGVRFESNANVGWSIDGYDLDMEVGGER